jgi:hypothetical protein
VRTFEYQGRAYEWEGGFGAVISSRERGLRRGEIRYILGELFYVFDMYPAVFRIPRIAWSLVGPINTEKVQEIRIKAFGC